MAVVTDKKGITARVPVIEVENARRTMAQAAARFYGEPSKNLTTVGITGTNGKTTTTYIVKSILAAAGAALAFGCDKSDVVAAFAGFKPEAHRLSLVGSVRGVQFYNDSKATNIASALSAAASVPGRIAMIIGGQIKGCPFDEFFNNLPSQVKFLAVIGESKSVLIAAASKAGLTDIAPFDDLKSAVQACCQKNVDSVLLAPAAASFDMFENYQKRGEMFIEIVKELSQSEG